MFEQTIITGKLAKDPEMRFMGNGQPMTTFTIPIDRGYTKEGGEKVEATQWYSVAVFGKQAESCATYLGKGSIVTVLGIPTPQGYLGTDGKPMASLSLKANSVKFILTKGKHDVGVATEAVNTDPLNGISNLQSLDEIPF